jgi:uncharacterized protein
VFPSLLTVPLMKASPPAAGVLRFASRARIPGRPSESRKSEGRPCYLERMPSSIRELVAVIDADPDLARVKAHLEASADAAHDVHHALRVALWTLRCAEGQVEARVAIAAALCHDLVNLPKNHPDRSRASEYSSEAARALLATGRFSEEEVDAIAGAIRSHSFSRGETPTTALGRALQDADRLEAVGAIGILRAAAVGGSLGARLFHPEDPFARDRPLDDRAFVVDHFFTKLLGLHSTMTTPRGREEARLRTETMRRFLGELGSELGAPPPPT